MSRSQARTPQAIVDLYERLVATNPDVERKGATVPYTSLNGHMFSFITTSGKLALRLPPSEREVFLEEYGTTLVEQHGAVMKEYVEIPDSLLRNTQKLRKYFALSYAYVGSLKPKKGRRK
jgi:hypothetical protein